MKNVITIEARKFPVTVESKEIDGFINDSIVISKQQLQAAQLVGQSSKELIERIYERKGFAVLDIGKPERKSIAIDLATLWEVSE